MRRVFFSAALRRAMEREKIGMSEFAKKLKVSRSAVFQALHSKSLSERTLVRYASKLGYDVELKLKRRKGR